MISQIFMVLSMGILYGLLVAMYDRDKLVALLAQSIFVPLGFGVLYNIPLIIVSTGFWSWFIIGLCTNWIGYGVYYITDKFITKELQV